MSDSGVRHGVEKISTRGTTLVQTSSRSDFAVGSYGRSKSGSPAGTILGLHFGSPENLCHLDVASMASCREYYMGEGGGFPRVQAVVSLVCPSARGLSQHPRVSRMLN
jgi:hypothetical protein